MKLTLRTSTNTHPQPVPAVPPIVPLPPPSPQLQRTLADLCNAYLAETRLDHAASTHYQRRIFCATGLGSLAALPLEEITPECLRRWKGEMAAHHTASTTHQYMARLAAILAFGVEIDWLTVHPMHKVRKPSPGRGRVRFLSPEERCRLLDACRQSKNRLLYALVVVALGTGGRKDEVRCLPWSAVDFEAGVIRFLKTKTDLDRAVPIIGEALQVLHALAQERTPGVPWVFPRPTISKPMAVESPWRAARRRAGLRDVHFHDLRHTYASYLAMSGASLRDIAELLGHKKIQQSMVYAHLIPSHTKGVVERMAQHFLQSGQEGSTHGE